MVEGTGFENQHGGNLIVSSNLTASALTLVFDCAILSQDILVLTLIYSSMTKENKPDGQFTKDVNVLVIITSSYLYGQCEIKIGNFCNLLRAKSLKSAKEIFELNKNKLDFVIITSILENCRHAETLPFVKQMRSDEEFKGKLIATGNYREEIFGKGKICHYECIFEDLAPLLFSMIKDLQKQKNLQKEKNTQDAELIKIVFEKKDDQTFDLHESVKKLQIHFQGRMQYN